MRPVGVNAGVNAFVNAFVNAVGPSWLRALPDAPV
jgi:hypothetical protein